MGAFDGELYRLGYRFEVREQKQNSLPKAVVERRIAVEQLHFATMPCPGSCSEVCPNHQCSAHNKQPYNWITSHIVRYRMSLYQADQFRAHLKEKNQ